MECHCWEYYRLVIKALEDADGNLPFEFEGYDSTHESITDMIADIQRKWNCIDQCWKK